MRKLLCLFFFLSFLSGYTFTRFVNPQKLYAKDKPKVEPGKGIYYHGQFVGCECPNSEEECYCITGGGSTP